MPLPASRSCARPYSFSLQRDLDSLAVAGVIVGTEKTWECLELRGCAGLATSVEAEIRTVVHRFQNRPTEEVLEYVYRTYPAYTVNSKREKLAERTVALPAVYTAGYEGLQIDGFLDLLVQTGIRRLIDVRNNPIARRFGFHKSTLNRLSGLLGIEYVHIPELGIASAARQNLVAPSAHRDLFEIYERTTLIDCADAVARVGEMMMEKSSVLVCMEAEACRCHRSRLGDAVSKRTGLPLKHLEGMK